MFWWKSMLEGLFDLKVNDNRYAGSTLFKQDNEAIAIVNLPQKPP